MSTSRVVLGMFVGLLVAGAWRVSIAAPEKPKVKKPALSAAELRVQSLKIPRLGAHVKPVVRPLDDIVKGVKAAPPTTPTTTPTTPPTPGKPLPPRPAWEPTLSAEELATDVVEITPERLGTVQVGVTVYGAVQTFKGFSWNWLGSWMMEPAKDSLWIFPWGEWIDGRALLVECEGWFEEPSAIVYGRVYEGGAEELGEMTIDNAGDATLAFVIPPVSLAWWRRLYVGVRDADGVGPGWGLRRCVFTRL